MKPNSGRSELVKILPAAPSAPVTGLLPITTGLVVHCHRPPETPVASGIVWGNEG